MPPPLIRTRQLTKQYDGYAAVNALEPDIQPGEIYGLIGPNGAGKTTLIRLLALAETPTAGEVYIQGQPVMRDRSNPEMRRLIGYLPDDFPLYNDLTVQDYLEYFGQLYYLSAAELRQRLGEVLALVSLEPKRHSPIKGLSRGMKQRLSLARTVIHSPQLLLLDEPVSGLDPIARIDYRETIKRLQQQGMTIVISSHILSDLEDFCTSIGVMEQGRLVASSQLQAFYHSDTHQIVIGYLGDWAEAEAYLEAHPLVETHQRSLDNRVELTFAGTEAQAADLLADLVRAGIRISEFHRVRATLEDIFVKLGYRQTA